MKNITTPLVPALPSIASDALSAVNGGCRSRGGCGPRGFCGFGGFGGFGFFGNVLNFFQTPQAQAAQPAAQTAAAEPQAQPQQQPVQQPWYPQVSTSVSVNGQQPTA